MIAQPEHRCTCHCDIGKERRGALNDWDKDDESRYWIQMREYYRPSHSYKQVRSIGDRNG
jgi:hypothetical protein